MRLNSSLCERLWAVEIGHCTDARPHGLVLGWQARKYWPLHSDGSGNTRRGTSRYILKKRQRAAESPRGQEHMSNWHLFTSESVSEGHPDKVADQISDAILDAILAQDKKARVACEPLVKTGMDVHAGEVTTEAWVDAEAVVRQTVNEIGYISSEIGFDWESCAVLSAIGKQSPDIAMGVDESENHEQGAGDQGMKNNNATNETDVLMPAPITYAHRLVRRQAELRKNGVMPWLRPDAKRQVTIRYDGAKPVAVEAVVLSTQHKPDISQSSLVEAVIEEIIFFVLFVVWLSLVFFFFVFLFGRFVFGGLVGVCVLS